MWGEGREFGLWTWCSPHSKESIDLKSKTISKLWFQASNLSVYLHHHPFCKPLRKQLNWHKSTHKSIYLWCFSIGAQFKFVFLRAISSITQSYSSPHYWEGKKKNLFQHTMLPPCGHLLYHTSTEKATHCSVYVISIRRTKATQKSKYLHLTIYSPLNTPLLKKHLFCNDYISWCGSSTEMLLDNKKSYRRTYIFILMKKWKDIQPGHSTHPKHSPLLLVNPWSAFVLGV